MLNQFGKVLCVLSPLTGKNFPTLRLSVLETEHWETRTICSNGTVFMMFLKVYQFHQIPQLVQSQGICLLLASQSWKNISALKTHKILGASVSYAFLTPRTSSPRRWSFKNAFQYKCCILPISCVSGVFQMHPETMNKPSVWLDCSSWQVSSQPEAKDSVTVSARALRSIPVQ